MAKDFLIRTGTGIDDVEYQSLDYLPIAGGTITGELNVPAPTKDSNAATKKYVDDYATSHSGFVKKTGDKMSGTLNMNDHSIIGLPTPAGQDEATNKQYVDGLFKATQSSISDANNLATEAKSTADANTTKINTINTTLEGLEWINTYKTLIEKLAAVAQAG